METDNLSLQVVSVVVQPPSPGSQRYEDEDLLLRPRLMSVSSVLNGHSEPVIGRIDEDVDWKCRSQVSTFSTPLLSPVYLGFSAIDTDNGNSTEEKSLPTCRIEKGAAGCEQDDVTLKRRCVSERTIRADGVEVEIVGCTKPSVGGKF